jgi:hypothetical protein
LRCLVGLGKINQGEIIEKKERNKKATKINENRKGT